MRRIPREIRRALYDLETAEDQWVQGILRTLVRAMNLPMGGCAREAVLADSGGFTLGERWSFGLPFEADELTRVAAGYVNNSTITSSLFPAAPTVATFRDLLDQGMLGEIDRVAEAWMKRRSIMDFLLVMASDHGASRLLVVLPQPRRITWSETTRVWRQIAVDLVAARRLRAYYRCNLPPSLPQENEADPPTGLVLWRGLLAGEWAITDSFTEPTGRRVFVTEPASNAPLSQREREVVCHVALGLSNKLGAYQLGVSTSTVATHLKNALAKLGLSSRVELVQLACQLVDDEENVAPVPVQHPAGQDVDFEQLEAALTFCACQLARLSDAESDEDQTKKIRELRATIRALDRLLPDG